MITGLPPPPPVMIPKNGFIERQYLLTANRKSLPPWDQDDKVPMPGFHLVGKASMTATTKMIAVPEPGFAAGGFLLSLLFPVCFRFRAMTPIKPLL